MLDDSAPPELIQSKSEEDMVLQFMFLQNQISTLGHCINHMMWVKHKKNPDGSDVSPEDKEAFFKGYRAYASSELSDILRQTRKLCNTMGLDYREVYTMADKREAEKRAEYESKNPGKKWV